MAWQSGQSARPLSKGVLTCEGVLAAVILATPTESSDPPWICVWVMKACSANASTTKNTTKRCAQFLRRVFECPAAAIVIKSAICKLGQAYAALHQLSQYSPNGSCAMTRRARLYLNFFPQYHAGRSPFIRTISGAKIEQGPMEFWGAAPRTHQMCDQQGIFPVFIPDIFVFASTARSIRPLGTNSQPPVRAEVEVSNLEMETRGRASRKFPDLRVSAAGPQTGHALKAPLIRRRRPHGDAKP